MDDGSAKAAVQNDHLALGVAVAQNRFDKTGFHRRARIRPAIVEKLSLRGRQVKLSGHIFDAVPSKVKQHQIIFRKAAKDFANATAHRPHIRVNQINDVIKGPNFRLFQNCG